MTEYFVAVLDLKMNAVVYILLLKSSYLKQYFIFYVLEWHPQLTNKGEP